MTLQLLGALATEAGGAGGENFLALGWVLPVITLLVILSWRILDTFYFRPLRAVLDERHRLTYGRLEEARALLEKAQKEQERYEAAIQEVRQWAHQLMAERRQQAEARRLELLEKTRQETRAQVEAARREIAKAADRAKREMDQYVEALALELTQKILGRPVETLPPGVWDEIRERFTVS